MRYIFLDNFRGFQDSVIPVSDVSFCVGENSSGKTSFLSAINLLASNRFWFDQDFEGNETGYKHFDDYISVNSQDRDGFRIGIAENIQRKTDTEPAASKRRVMRAFLFKYMENAGLPRLHCCTTIIEDKIITVYYSSNGIKYKIIDVPADMTLESFSSGAFLEWKDVQDDEQSREIVAIKDRDLKRGFFPALYAISIAFRHASTRAGKSRSGNALWFPTPAFGGEAAWIAPIRTKPQRTYDEVRLSFSPDGTHVPYVLKKMLTRNKKSKTFTEFLQRFGRESGLFKEVKIHSFGRTKTSPFEIEIILDVKPLNISNVGYGVSQVLPVVVEALVRPRDALFAVQQPEVHLHPRAQAAIGEMLFVLASEERKKFIVETHSDFTIDRFRMSMRRSKTKVDSQVLFFQRADGRNIVTRIAIEKNGMLADSQPAAYREFFLNESMNVIGV